MKKLLLSVLFLSLLTVTAASSAFAMGAQGEYKDCEKGNTTPVPEPSSLALLALGAAGLGLYKKTKK